MRTAQAAAGPRRTGWAGRWRNVWKHRDFYVFMIPAMIVTFVYSYIPMYGILMAFQNVKIGQRFGAGTWVGLDNFRRLFNSGTFEMILKNTLSINLITTLCTIPIPIVLAILLHNCTVKPLKRVAQTATYIPYLISVVVVVSIINLLCNGEFGLINILRASIGLPKIAFFGETKWVLPLYVVSAVWQTAGYNAVIYLAALAGIDAEQVEAAMIDGATKVQRIWYIDIPTIKPTIITLLTLNLGRLMTMNVDKILLLQTDLNLRASETISTYVYKTGIVGAQYGFSTAVGLFNNVCNLALLLLVNYISRRLAKTSVF